MRKVKSKRRSNKRPVRKAVRGVVWSGDGWVVVHGRLVPPPGRPPGESQLFRYVGEKLPYDCLHEVRKHMKANADHLEAVYLAHDSMGVARYGGRGQIFYRLHSHKRKYPRELVYFSFYVVKDKMHEREIETVILRAAGPQMILNTQKVRTGIRKGSVFDFEAGTSFFERQKPKGKQRKSTSKAAKDR